MILENLAAIWRVCGGPGRGKNCGRPGRPKPTKSKRGKKNPPKKFRVGPAPRGERVKSIRQALLSAQETLSVEAALGRVLADPTVSCPPAVPILVCGERVDQRAVECFRYYGRRSCAVMKET